MAEISGERLLVRGRLFLDDNDLKALERGELVKTEGIPETTGNTIRLLLEIQRGE